MKNRGLKITVFILLIISASSVMGVLYLLSESNEQPNRELTIKEQVEYSHLTDKIDLNLADDRYVRLQFSILTNGNKAREEVQLREFQFKNILIKETVDMTSEDLQSDLSDFERGITEEMNKLMEVGEVTDIYIVSKIIQ